MELRKQQEQEEEAHHAAASLSFLVDNGIDAVSDGQKAQDVERGQNASRHHLNMQLTKLGVGENGVAHQLGEKHIGRLQNSGNKQRTDKGPRNNAREAFVVKVLQDFGRVDAKVQDIVDRLHVEGLLHFGVGSKKQIAHHHRGEEDIQDPQKLHCRGEVEESG